MGMYINSFNETGQNPDIDPHIYYKLIYEKDGTVEHCEKAGK